MVDTFTQSCLAAQQFLKSHSPIMPDIPKKKNFDSNVLIVFDATVRKQLQKTKSAERMRRSAAYAFSDILVDSGDHHHSTNSG